MSVSRGDAVEPCSVEQTKSDTGPQRTATTLVSLQFDARSNLFLLQIIIILKFMHNYSFLPHLLLFTGKTLLN